MDGLSKINSMNVVPKNVLDKIKGKAELIECPTCKGNKVVLSIDWDKKWEICPICKGGGYVMKKTVITEFLTPCKIDFDIEDDGKD